jgi:ABC-type bacteriocin/lantibiotic exporter with double-glycine peptidase domain
VDEEHGVDATGAPLPERRTHSPVPIPHHFQQTEYTCGPSSLAMMLEAVWGIPVPEAHLNQRLATNAEIGTRQRAIREYLLGLGLDVLERHTDTALDEIRLAMKDGRVVLVLYHLELPEEHTDHYAVVVRIGPNSVLLHDPYRGPATRMTLGEFDAAWRTDGSVQGRKNRWMLAVHVPTPAT